MKKIIRLVLASILGIALIFLLNISTKNLAISRAGLPFSWEGPYYWVTTSSPHDHSSGLPFMMVKYNAVEGAYYISTLALSLNVASGVVLGLCGDAIFPNLKGVYIDNVKNHLDGKLTRMILTEGINYATIGSELIIIEGGE